MCASLESATYVDDTIFIRKDLGICRSCGAIDSHTCPHPHPGPGRLEPPTNIATTSRPHHAVSYLSSTFAGPSVHTCCSAATKLHQSSSLNGYAGISRMNPRVPLRWPTVADKGREAGADAEQAGDWSSLDGEHITGKYSTTYSM